MVLLHRSVFNTVAPYPPVVSRIFHYVIARFKFLFTHPSFLRRLDSQMRHALRRVLQSEILLSEF